MATSSSTELPTSSLVGDDCYDHVSYRVPSTVRRPASTSLRLLGHRETPDAKAQL